MPKLNGSENPSVNEPNNVVTSTPNVFNCDENPKN